MEPTKPASKLLSDRDAQQLASRWVALAEAGDLRGLALALAVGKARKEAARTLMQVSPSRYAAFQARLVEGLTARSDRTRYECAAALDTFGDASTREALVRRMDDPTPRVRWMAMHALSCHACGDKAAVLEAPIRERIVAALGDPSPKVRRHAAVALRVAGGA